MLDGVARTLIDPPLNWTARRLATAGFGANAVTIAGFAAGAGGCVAIGFELYSLALVLIAINRIADGLDGAIARRTGSTDLGGFLDIVLDTIFYSGVPFAFAVSRPEFALPAAFVIFSFVGTGGSFLAFAVIAGKRKQETQRSGKKSFFYSAGLMEGTETVVFLVLVCVLPESFPALAWTFGGLCWLTTALRITAGVRAFGSTQE